MKGKYAAKAKNRLANLDNEILQEVIAERDQLRRDLESERAQREAVERDLVSRALREASRLAEEDIKREREERRVAEAEFEKLKSDLAAWIAQYFKMIQGKHPDIEFIPRDVTEVFKRLAGPMYGIYLSEFLPNFSTRAHRRLSDKKVRKNRDVNGLDERDRRTRLVDQMRTEDE